MGLNFFSYVMGEEASSRQPSYLTGMCSFDMISLKTTVTRFQMQIADTPNYSSVVTEKGEMVKGKWD